MPSTLKLEPRRQRCTQVAALLPQKPRKLRGESFHQEQGIAQVERDDGSGHVGRRAVSLTTLMSRLSSILLPHIDDDRDNLGAWSTATWLSGEDMHYTGGRIRRSPRLIGLRMEKLHRFVLVPLLCRSMCVDSRPRVRSVVRIAFWRASPAGSTDL